MDRRTQSEDFQGYRRIVIVANNDRLDIGALQARFDEGTLFVFFNRAERVLKAPFRRPGLLVVRSDVTGLSAETVGKLEPGLSLLDGPDFQGIVNLRGDGSEVFGSEVDFKGRKVSFLDLSTYFEGFYTPRRLPSSGFAFAIWLMEGLRDTEIHLCGFTGQRDEDTKILLIHDWGFEQTVLRALMKGAKLHDATSATSAGAMVERISKRFGDLDPRYVVEAGLEATTERLDGANTMIDLLWSKTKAIRLIDGFFRSLMPKSRRQKMVDAARPGWDPRSR